MTPPDVSPHEALLPRFRRDLLSDLSTVAAQASTLARHLSRATDAVAVVWTRRGNVLRADSVVVPESDRGASLHAKLASRPIDAKAGVLAKVVGSGPGLAPPLDKPLPLDALWGPVDYDASDGPFIADILLHIIPGIDGPRGLVGVLLPLTTEPWQPLDDAAFTLLCDEASPFLSMAWERRRLEARNKRLLRVNTDLRRYAHLVSHDLQEPVRTLGGLAGLLRRRYGDQLDDKPREWLDLMVDGADRARQLIVGMLAFAEYDENLQFEPVDTEVLLTEVLQDLHLRIVQAGATIEREPMPALVADPTQLRRVFINLIKNALGCTVEGRPPVLRFWAEETLDDWVLAFSDNGHGFAPGMAERLFHRFYSDRDDDELSTGVGLTEVKRILQGHGGRAWAESEPDVLTTFYVALPHDAGVYLDSPST